MYRHVVLTCCLRFSGKSSLRPRFPCRRLSGGGPLGPAAGRLRQAGRGRGCLCCCPSGFSGRARPRRPACPAKSGRHTLPPSPARESSPLPASAVSAAVPKDGRSQTALCAGTLFQSPAGVFTASTVVLKAKQTRFCYSSPQKLPPGLPVTAPAPRGPRSPASWAQPACQCPSRPLHRLLHGLAFCPAACPFTAPSPCLRDSFLSGGKLPLRPETQDGGALGSALTPHPRLNSSSPTVLHSSYVLGATVR